MKRISKLLSKKTLSCLGLSATILFGGIPAISNPNAYAASEPDNFEYTGAPQEYIAPHTGTYKFQVWGAQGGNALGVRGYRGGLGGYSEAVVHLTANQIISVYVGGQGIGGARGASGGNGGWNGGGSGGLTYSYYSTGGGGGGASDIRIGGTSFSNRVIVAGAGGGAAEFVLGGYGGGSVGGNGYGRPDAAGGKGGTQSSGGSGGIFAAYLAQSGTLGTGGDGIKRSPNSGGGGGGAGYYGGGGGVGGGGGGSGYIGDVMSSNVMASGNQSMPSPSGSTEIGHQGDGYARITLIKIDDTTPPVTTDDAPKDWINKDVTVNLTATDNDGGSGVANTYYTLDNSPQQSGKSVDITSEGEHTLTYWSEDKVGNVEDKHTVTVKIDKTAPTLNISLDKTSIWPANGKMVPLTAAIDASDAASGIDSVVLTSITSNEPLQSNDIQNAKYNTPITGSTDTFELRAKRLGNGTGRVYTTTYTGTDKAGNVATKSVSVAVLHDQSKKNK